MLILHSVSTVYFSGICVSVEPPSQVSCGGSDDVILSTEVCNFAVGERIFIVLWP